MTDFHRILTGYASFVHNVKFTFYQFTFYKKRAIKPPFLEGLTALLLCSIVIIDHQPKTI